MNPRQAGEAQHFLCSAKKSAIKFYLHYDIPISLGCKKKKLDPIPVQKVSFKVSGSNKCGELLDWLSSHQLLYDCKPKALVST
jgi:hypothetical protein